MNTTLYVVFFGVAEALFTRWLFHFVLAVRIGWGPWITDADFVFVLPLSFAFYLFLLGRYGAHSLSIRFQHLRSHFFIWSGFVLYTSFFYKAAITGYCYAIWWLLSALVALSGLRIFADRAYFLNRNSALVLPPILIAIFAAPIGREVSIPFWTLTLPTTRSLVERLAELFVGDRFTLAMDKTNSIVVVSSKLFTFYIHSGCSGSDGLIIFASVTCLLYAIAKLDRAPTDGFSVLLVTGVIFAYALNLFRLSLILIAGEVLHLFLPPFEAGQILADIVHANLGWTICAGGLVVWYFASHALLCTFRAWCRLQTWSRISWKLREIGS